MLVALTDDYLGQQDQGGSPLLLILNWTAAFNMADYNMLTHCFADVGIWGLPYNGFPPFSMAVTVKWLLEGLEPLAKYLEASSQISSCGGIAMSKWMPPFLQCCMKIRTGHFLWGLENTGMPPEPHWGSISHDEDIPCHPTFCRLDTCDQGMVEVKKQLKLNPDYLCFSLFLLQFQFQHSESGTPKRTIKTYCSHLYLISYI